MATLSQRYSAKEKIGSDITTRKTFLVPLNEIYAEDGYNVRELNQAHVEEFRDAFIAGEYIPPLAVEVTEQGVKVIDGHHRFHGALLASEAGHEVMRLECKDFLGTEADKIAFMVTSSQGLALTPIERGAAYQRLVNQGWTNAEIAKKVKRSESDILQHLQLQECSPYIKSLVRAGSINYALAIQINREHGVYADREAARLMKKAEESGKKKSLRASPSHNSTLPAPADSVNCSMMLRQWFVKRVTFYCSFLEPEKKSTPFSTNTASNIPRLRVVKINEHQPE